MQAEVQQERPLERKLDFSFPTAAIEAQVGTKLREIARTAKFHGFRPGKVPMKIVAQQYGSQVRQEVMSDSLQRSFSEKIKEQNIRIAGYPRFEPKVDGVTEDNFEFTAVYEVYPEVAVGTLTDKTIKRPIATIDDAQIDKTIEVLRKQRVHFHEVARAAQNGDQCDIDYDGILEGKPFDGGHAKGALVVLGEGRLMADFEANMVGLKAGDSKGFDIAFPDRLSRHTSRRKNRYLYGEVKQSQRAAFAGTRRRIRQGAGHQGRKLEDLRADVKANLDRELKRRMQGKVKESVMQALA